MTRRVLIIQLADIGDLALTTPALAALRAAYPDAHIAVLTSPHAAPVLDGTGLADNVIRFDKRIFDSVSRLIRPSGAIAFARLLFTLRRGGYDTAIVPRHLSTALGAWKIRILLMASGARARVGLDNGRGRLYTHPLPDRGFGAMSEAEYALALVSLLGADASAPSYPARIASGASPLASKSAPLRIALHAGSGGYSTARRWEAERFAAVADALHAEHGAEVILVGGPGDDSAAVMRSARAPITDLTGRTSLPDLAAALASCDLFIGADSGVMHIAAAAGIPVVALFGPSNHAAWHPHSERFVLVRSGVRCSPCAYIGTAVNARDGCLARTCMRLITPADVLAAARRALAGQFDGQPVQHVPERATPIVRILAMPVSIVTFDEWIAHIAAWIEAGGAHHVCTINPEMIMTARRDPVFRTVLDRADLTVPDGIGLLLAARWRGVRLPERVTGSDGVPLIAAEAARRGWTLFFLGAGPGVAQAAANALTAQHPGLRIVGVHEGSPRSDEEDAIAARVRASGAHILLVAYGAPEQDKWIARNLHRLNVNVAIGVGGTFDFIAGTVPRAPLMWRRLGVEWLYRLIIQPWRIRRMLRLPVFAALAAWEAARMRGKRDAR